MKVDVILGLQWGDEGKGKIVDVMTPQYDIIARFQGGPNAGHTIEFKNRKYVLHTIPSGIFYPKKTNLVGNGVILDPFIFRKEIINLAEYGIDATSNLLVSKKAHLITPTHRLLDAAYEALKGESRIGSTLKGIGPTYTDKVARIGLRVGDILRDDFRVMYFNLRENHLRLMQFMEFNADSFLIDDIPFNRYEEQWLDAVDYMKTLKLVDAEYFLHRSLAAGKRVLAEGAQGTMLDVDFGSYPFVTSSNTSIGGVCSGLGINPGNIGEVTGVFKAYCTRVGSGPFPTEQFGDQGDKMRERGHEYGSTTGRPRRCGWLDLVALKYAIMINGVTRLFMMKTDVLDDFSRILIGNGYMTGKGKTGDVPFDFLQEDIKVIYKELRGWETSLKGLKSKDEMPVVLQEYVDFIEKETGIPVMGVSFGPDRTQTLIF
ncbi:MAG: adenylosuccinate synthase [Bacteroidales bacterium]|nr:adenylosuccinate synthase [Bacteroidales bacterium]